MKLLHDLYRMQSSALVKQNLRPNYHSFHSKSKWKRKGDL